MLLPGYREKSGTFLQLHSWGHHPPSFPFWSLPLLSRAPSGGSRYLFVSKSSTFLPAQLKLYWPPLSGHPRKVPIFSRGCPCLFLKGLGSLPYRCRPMLSARKVELFGSFIRRGYHLPLFFQQGFSFSAPGKNTSGELGAEPPSGISAFESFYHLFIVCLPPWSRDTENVHTHQLPLYDS